MAVERKQLTRRPLSSTTTTKKTREQAEAEFDQLLARGGSTLSNTRSTTTSKQTTGVYSRADSAKRAQKRVEGQQRAAALAVETTATETTNQKKSTGRGGARVGAGRPVGSLSSKTQQLVAQLTADGMSPLEYMLTNMRDVKNPESFRAEMAKAAAPFIHPKLASTELSAPNGKPLIPPVVGTVPIGAAEAVAFYKDLLG